MTSSVLAHPSFPPHSIPSPLAHSLLPLSSFTLLIFLHLNTICSTLSSSHTGIVGCCLPLPLNCSAYHYHPITSIPLHPPPLPLLGPLPYTPPPDIHFSLLSPRSFFCQHIGSLIPEDAHVGLHPPQFNFPPLISTILLTTFYRY